MAASTDPFLSGNTVGMKATQREGQIIIETRSEGRSGKMVETYTISPNCRQLNVTLSIEGERLNQPLVIRRVYDAAETCDLNGGRRPSLATGTRLARAGRD